MSSLAANLVVVLPMILICLVLGNSTLVAEVLTASEALFANALIPTFLLVLQEESGKNTRLLSACFQMQSIGNRRKCCWRNSGMELDFVEP